MKIVCVKASRLAAWLGAIAAALAAIMAMVSVGSFAVGAKAVKRKLPVYSVERFDKKIAISFDCAWGVEHTDAILTELERHGVKCTFFAVSFWVEKYPEYAKKIVEAGHELGTHSKTHPHMTQISRAAIREELSYSSKVIEETVGVAPTLFRPPFGDYNDALIEECEAAALLPIQWDVDSLDWKDLSANEISMRVINGAREGSIILCHNNGLHTAEALPVIFSTLQNRGFEFVPIGRLVYWENYAIDGTGRQKQGV